jgi:hypothetical protein
VPSRRRFNRIKLGPVVGHTTESSTTIWIQAFDDPSLYQLRIQGAGTFDFVSTENGVLEFCTGIAVAQGLRSDWRYQYSILRKGRRLLGASGTFRTMPATGSSAPILFCPISCNSDQEPGSWEALKKFVDSAKPHFLLMMGDQVYNDDDTPDVFELHHDSPVNVRRRALAEKYLKNWSREPVRHVLSHLPTYMMWDDHDIRDGWGSLAADSPTMAQRYPRGQKIFEICDQYYRDARDVFWHFQGCHNAPLPTGFQGWPFSTRTALPCTFICGRVLVLMIDSRGQRDVFRQQLPIMGPEQWAFIDQLLADIPEWIDALVVMTPTPIASMDPHGASQKLVGRRTDDIEAFKRGDFKQAVTPKGSSDVSQFALAAAGSHLTSLLGGPVNLGNFNVNAIDEARDQWSHSFARPEQARLLKSCAQARLTNRYAGGARELLFVSGDIHVGGIYDISIEKPKCKVISLTSSGISTVENLNPKPTIGSILDDSFEVTSGIHSKLREVVTEFNFGVVQITPSGLGAELLALVAHRGNAWAVGVDIADLL